MGSLANASGRRYQQVATSNDNTTEWLTSIALVLNAVAQGKTNNTGSVTLTANVTTTTLSDKRIGANSAILLMPTTANAAGALATTYFNTFAKGSCVINHANAATTDRTFTYVVVG